ncbi:hypothetical protein D7X74_35245 [Corallococcus sp. CA047B]|uniref:hypothetical protein n=1 Tax=Corallococcus sp. CA047B TaxID=2316729 RepID=UPI000EA3013E|nr:hypothetical protein [Corallococcus sp. CA047B]RKH04626.1 hypothetical protein D7X74_35245 [Corallococcus sp. CA047B]
MNAVSHWVLLFALAGGLPAAAQQAPLPTEAKERPAPVEPVHPEARPVPTDVRRQEPPLTDEDREVVENLELLESLDAATDLEVLLELSEDP